jgi:hypothetical protein
MSFWTDSNRFAHVFLVICIYSSSGKRRACTHSKQTKKSITMNNNNKKTRYVPTPHLTNVYLLVYISVHVQKQVFGSSNYIFSQYVVLIVPVFLY